jgi:hypothetical protein
MLTGGLFEQQIHGPVATVSRSGRTEGQYFIETAQPDSDLPFQDRTSVSGAIALAVDDPYALESMGDTETHEVLKGIIRFGRCQSVQVQFILDTELTSFEFSKRLVADSTTAIYHAVVRCGVSATLAE